MQRTAFFVFVFLLLAASRTGAQSLHQQPSYASVTYRIESEAEAHAKNGTTALAPNVMNISQLLRLISGKQQISAVIGFTREQRPIKVYHFPGRSANRAMVIGGVHGTELASIEVANQLVQQLAAGDTPFYNVLIIPTLFPDNAAQAMQQGNGIGSTKNIGRYTHAAAPDPNRQMPPLGKPYDPETNTDALGRPIEYENGLLLQLIQDYQPQRIVNIHAIRDTAQGGIYADPRTDAAGYALEYQSDSSLAIAMAQVIEQDGGAAPGNKLQETPTALYYKDPPVAAPGHWQKRNCHGSVLSNNRGHGVSLGSWASTAVIDSAHAENNRPAIRLLTMEFPGYKRPQDYSPEQRPYQQKQVQLYAAAIQTVFLEASFVEE